MAKSKSGPGNVNDELLCEPEQDGADVVVPVPSTLFGGFNKMFEMAGSSRLLRAARWSSTIVSATR